MKRPHGAGTINFEPISLAELTRVVKASKKISTSSIKLKRTHAVFKYALHCTKFTEMLLHFYNTIITKEYYLNRWTNIIEVMLEKGKGPIINKICTIQLIEADL